MIDYFDYSNEKDKSSVNPKISLIVADKLSILVVFFLREKNADLCNVAMCKVIDSNCLRNVFFATCHNHAIVILREEKQFPFDY